MSQAAPRWHLPVLVVACAVYESLFIYHGVNIVDEGWPLYAAKRWLEGAPLFSDAFFVFPPGHLLPSVAGLLLDPPGLVVSRSIYAFFQIAAAVGIYLFGRRVMPPGFALFGALLIGLATPRSHLAHHVFGYRYMAFSLISMLLFAWRLEGGKRSLLVWAGLACGIGFCVRLDSLAAAAAIGVGTLVTARSWREAVEDGLLFGAGALLAIVPVALWVLAEAGAESAWLEIFVRPVEMTRLQSLPMPTLVPPEQWVQPLIARWFSAIQFRLFILLYLAYAVAVTRAWWQARRRGEPPADPLLLTLVVFGAAYFTRTLGRSDEAHLDSALPPAYLLLAHALWRASVWARVPPRLVTVGLVLFFAGWTYMLGTVFVLRSERGTRPLVFAKGEIRTRDGWGGRSIDWVVAEMLRRTRPGDIVLDLTSSPMVHVLADRNGPGGADIIMPGTFLDAEEERVFIERLERNPPKLVLWPAKPFDRHSSDRRFAVFQPVLADWVRTRYAPGPKFARFRLMVPKEEVGEPGSSPEPDSD
jgi:hypothetical protein